MVLVAVHKVEPVAVLVDIEILLVQKHLEQIHLVKLLGQLIPEKILQSQ